MGRRSLLSLGLFILPIAITVAVLVGVETFRVSHGYGLTWSDNAIETATYCQKSYGITPTPGRFTLNPNQWGTTGDSGLCMNVTTFHNQSYATNTTAPPFTVTWQYDAQSVDEPVHAFPNAKLMLPDVIPTQLSNLSAISIDVAWTYGAGHTVASSTNDLEMIIAGMNANVCVDMFLDPIASNSGSTNTSKYEIMVWLGRYGTATDPIGILEGSQKTVDVNGTNFDLFYGDNSIGQRVFTWVAQGNTTDFSGHIDPLIEDLDVFGGPSMSDHLGYVAFGSEALFSLADVTFAVPRLAMDVITL